MFCTENKEESGSEDGEGGAGEDTELRLLIAAVKRNDTSMTEVKVSAFDYNAFYRANFVAYVHDLVELMRVILANDHIVLLDFYLAWAEMMKMKTMMNIINYYLLVFIRGLPCALTRYKGLAKNQISC